MVERSRDLEGPPDDGGTSNPPARLGGRNAALETPLAAGSRSRIDPLELFILDPRTDGQKARDARAGRVPSVAKILATYRNGRVIEDFPLRGGKAGKRFERIRWRQQAIRAYIDGAEDVKRLPDSPELRHFGTDLFECLFPSGVRRLYDSVRKARHDRLDILLTSMVHWVADLPWEFAFDTARGTFLAMEEINFVRNVVTAIPAEEIPGRSGPLRILVVTAQPVGWGEVSIAEEIALVSRGFRRLADAGLVRFEVLRSVSPEVLHKRLQFAQLAGERFDVLHFIGHGKYDEGKQTGYLVFEDGHGVSNYLDTNELRQLLCRREIRILFLNACETGSGSRSDFNRGVAQGLVAGGVPIVIGNQYKVLDSSATAFAQHFYWALAHGATVGEAAREARVAVNYSLGDAIDWAVPVVFAQNPRETLCQQTQTGWHEQKEQMARRRKAPEALRRIAPPTRRRIGLWDVNNALPQLEKIVEHLNQIQAWYVFEIVELTAPIGTWRLVREGDGPARGYVYAEQVVSRLQNQLVQLGLRKLLCFTIFPLRDQDLLKVYSWDEDTQDRIALFSFADFEHDFRRPGLSVERAVANLVSGSLTPVEPHFDGVKSCPCYFSGERDPQYVAGPLDLCQVCRAGLDSVVARGEIGPEDIAAAEALLRAYPE